MGVDFGLSEAMIAAGATGGSLGAEAGGAAAAAAAASTPWLAYAGLAMSGLSTIAGASGAYNSGRAQQGAANYNAAIASQNAQIARENATHAGQAGEQTAAMSEMKTRAAVGSIKANQAAAGVDVNSGSAVDVRSSAAELGELDAINIRSKAAQDAYGYENQAKSFDETGELDKFTGENAETAGTIGAASTFLGGAGSAATNFARWQLQSSPMSA
jgi:hypothetical protein